MECFHAGLRSPDHFTQKDALVRPKSRIISSKCPNRNAPAKGFQSEYCTRNRTYTFPFGTFEFYCVCQHIRSNENFPGDNVVAVSHWSIFILKSLRYRWEICCQFFANFIGSLAFFSKKTRTIWWSTELLIIIERHDFQFLMRKVLWYFKNNLRLYVSWHFFLHFTIVSLPTSYIWSMLWSMLIVISCHSWSWW